MGLGARSLYFSLSQLFSWPGNGGNAFRRCRTAHGPKCQGNMTPSNFEINTCIAWWNLKKRKGRWATVSMQVCSASVTVQSLVQIKPCLVCRVELGLLACVPLQVMLLGAVFACKTRFYLSLFSILMLRFQKSRWSLERLVKVISKSLRILCEYLGDTATTLSKGLKR